MFLILIFFPFLNFILCMFFGNRIGYKGVKILTPWIMGFPLLIISIYLFLIIAGQNIIEELLWTWISVVNFDLSFNIIWDNLSSSMLFLVFLISFFVHVFSFSYMENDPHFQRFIGYLSLFTFFMVILITSNNLLQLFIGWEGVGLCSYLLINFWFTRIEANKASIKAMVINKIGDLGFLLGLLLIWGIIGGIDYKTIFCSINFDIENVELIGFLLFIGVIGKSAQLGLHTWLPDAMEGPTPVSALIHAATMVTAGVFLVIRLSPFFDQLKLMSLIIIIFGGLTCLSAAFIALPQTDIKKVIAYSTCSQLGYMILICGFYSYDTGLFHLINHGMFKALLFLSAGSIIHINYDDQDIRKMGFISTPITYVCFLIGSISLAGLPFMTGFFSKDLIIELIYFNHIFSFAIWLSLFAVMLTTLYSCKLLYSSFFLLPQNSPSNFSSYHESNHFIIYPLIILSIFSVAGGYFMKCIILNEEFLIISTLMKSFPVILCFIGFLIYTFLYLNFNLWFKLKLTIKSWYTFLTDALFFNLIFNQFFYKVILRTGFQIYKHVDNQIFEIFGPKKYYSFYWQSSSQISTFNSGYIKLYIITFLLVVSLCFISIYY